MFYEIWDDSVDAEGETGTTIKVSFLYYGTTSLVILSIAGTAFA